MNKKEINEIKRQFTEANCTLNRIRCCYVDYEKQKKTELNEAFLSLPQEETFKYFDIFQKALSGTIGKNLLNMEFPLEQEQEGGSQAFLLKLRQSRLEDDDLVNTFFDKVIENYEYEENYYIILVHGAYDIPGRGSDGLDMFDASSEIYEHLLFCICPVKQTKAGLFYNQVHNIFEDRAGDWYVDKPAIAFLFPLFQDRSSDIHGLLYYAAKPETQHAGFAQEVLGCTAPLSPAVQKEAFNALVEETLGDECSYDTVVAIQEKIHEMIEARKEEPDPVVLGKSDVRRVLEECGVSNEKLGAFEEQYDLNAGEDTTLMASNITNTRKMEVKMPDITVNVTPEKAMLLETAEINGRTCLIIPLDADVAVNGIHVRNGSLAAFEPEDADSGNFE